MRCLSDSVSPFHRVAACRLAVLAVVAFCTVSTAERLRADEIDFNRQIRPIISSNCLACHGFDESSRKADLRLDSREGALADRGGYAAIVPGKPQESAMIDRITATDPDTLMPPADSHKKPLDQRSVQLLREWIRQGASWGKHWSFEKPTRASVPKGRHPIDALVARQLHPTGLRAAPRAADHTLLRRLSFDITGLPPSREHLTWLTARTKKPSQQDWGKIIDQLLTSPHYGERMAMWWLDGARYSDTDGFQQDGTRTNWPWRDWVAQAFNNNMHFDQFTIEQFAGDLLPNATVEQRLATCFHRNHMNNGEGGRDPEESRIDYVLDRVNTTGTLWLGLTLGCTQCHDHKFDPISQVDYYSLSAYFNSIDETGAAGSRAGPYLKYRSAHAQLAVAEAAELLRQSDKQLAAVTAQTEKLFESWLTRQIARTRGGYQPWDALRPARLSTVEGYQLSCTDGWTITSAPSELPQDDFIITASPGSLQRITGLRLEVFPDTAHTDGKYSYSPSGEFILTNIKLRVRRRGSSQIREIPIASAVADVEGVGLDATYKTVRDTLDDDPRRGWTTRTKPSNVPHQAIFGLDEPLTLDDNEQLEVILMQRSLAPRELMGRFRLSLTDQRGEAVRSLAPMPLQQLAALKSEGSLKPSDIGPELRSRLRNQFLQDQPSWQAAKQRNASIRRQQNEAKSAAGELNVMVLARRKTPRATHVLQRGVWDKKGKTVGPGVLPAILPRSAAKVPSRLELARWIVDRDNPLTARVIVNQVWQLFLGAGLVRTPSDFGAQGESPTHPELLDWLAVEFMDSGWDLKHLVRMIVTSRTYQQDSSVSAALLKRDPENRLLARGARFRLPSWMIRDNALRASGLLSPMIGGPPVFPYQPEGVWKDQFMGRFVYRPTLGPAQYRRTLYAFWRRSSAPTFLFDAAMRRTCEVITRRTNTPLHALTLLNDTTSLEAARALADASLSDASLPGTAPAEASPAEASPAVTGAKALRRIYLAVLSRFPSDTEALILRQKHDLALAFYKKHPEQARTFTIVGQMPEPPQDQIAERAALMLMANMILNLDEAMTHE